MGESKRDAGTELLVLMMAVDAVGVHNEVARAVQAKLDTFEGEESAEHMADLLTDVIKDLGFQDKVGAQVLAMAFYMGDEETDQQTGF